MMRASLVLRKLSVGLLPLQGEGRDGDGCVEARHLFNPIPSLTLPLKGRAPRRSEVHHALSMFVMVVK